MRDAAGLQGRETGEETVPFSLAGPVPSLA